MIEGDADRGIEAMAPDLKTVADLAMYAEVFKDPEEPSKGRFYNCIIGWQCELINNDKMATYGLEEHFTNFRPGASAALAASLAGAYEKGEAWLGYYWGPTWVLGSYDMVMIEEPAHSDDCWVDGDRGCSFPPSIVNVAVSTAFADAASEEMIEFLRAYEVDQLLVSAMLAYMKRQRGRRPPTPHATSWTPRRTCGPDGCPKRSPAAFRLRSTDKDRRFVGSHDLTLDGGTLRCPRSCI